MNEQLIFSFLFCLKKYIAHGFARWLSTAFVCGVSEEVCPVGRAQSTSFVPFLSFSPSLSATKIIILCSTVKSDAGQECVRIVGSQALAASDTDPDPDVDVDVDGEGEGSEIGSDGGFESDRPGAGGRKGGVIL